MQIGTPNFTNGQFVDAPLLNTAFGIVSGAIAGIAKAIWPAPGLLYPEIITLASSGLVVSGTFPVPFALINGSGVVATGQGIANGSTSDVYAIDFTSLVPASGTIQAYILASATTVQEQPIGVPGPPPGHPSYNPNFVPATSYQQVVNTLQVAASMTPADDVSTFEIARTVLTAGQSSFASGAFFLADQVRVPVYSGKPVFPIVNGNTILATWAYYALVSNGGSFPATVTLPPAQSVAGLPFSFMNISGLSTLTVDAASGDFIIGFDPNDVSSVTLPALSSMSVWSNGNTWMALTASPSFSNFSGQLLGPPILLGSAGTITSGMLPPGTNNAFAVLFGGGGAGGSAASTASGQASVGTGGTAGSRVAAWIAAGGIIGATYSCGAAGTPISAAGDTVLTPNGGSAIIAKGGPTGASSGANPPPLVAIGQYAVGSTPIGTNGVIESNSGMLGAFGLVLSTAPVGIGGTGGCYPEFGGGGVGGIDSSIGPANAGGAAAGGGGAVNGAGAVSTVVGGVGGVGVIFVWPYS